MLDGKQHNFVTNCCNMWLSTGNMLYERSSCLHIQLSSNRFLWRLLCGRGRSWRVSSKYCSMPIVVTSISHILKSNSYCENDLWEYGNIMIPRGETYLYPKYKYGCFNASVLGKLSCYKLWTVRLQKEQHLLFFGFLWSFVASGFM